MDNGSHNVSRWMTWLPISLKNAVKCDKWYQLQNHSITESLNANGAWEKLYCVIPVHAIFSVSNKKQHTPPPLFSLYMYNIYVGARGGVCLCCAHIYIYIRTRIQVRVGQKYTPALSFRDVRVEKLLSGDCKAVSLSSLLSILSSPLTLRGGRGEVLYREERCGGRL